jgi:hypothetical protein
VVAIPWLADVGVGCLPGDPLRAAMMVARQSEAVNAKASGGSTLRAGWHDVLC